MISYFLYKKNIILKLLLGHQYQLMLISNYYAVYCNLEDCSTSFKLIIIINQNVYLPLSEF